MKETVRQTGIDQLRQGAEKTVSLSPADFQKIPLADVQQLLRDLLSGISEKEAQTERLRQDCAGLEEARNRFAELFDFAPVGYFNLDSEGVILSANITGSEMLSMSWADLVGTSFLDIIEPQYHKGFRSHLKEAGDTGDRLSAEVDMRRSDSTAFCAQLQTMALYEKSNITFRISVTDITERKRAEDALRESEQRFKDLAELIPEIVFEADVHGTFTYFNKKALATLGLGAADLKRKINIFKHVLPEERSAARKRFARVLEEGDIGGNEYTIVRKDGTVFPSLVHTARIMREGKPQGVRGVAIDVSELKKAEQALKESEKRLRTTLDSVLEGCVILDFDWRYLYANNAAGRLMKLTKEKRIGRTLMEVFPGIEKQDTFAHLKRCMESRLPDRYETEFTFPEGSKAWFDVRAEPVPEGIVILYVDITERKQAEQRLQRGIERLERIYGAARVAKMQPIGLLMIEHRLIERVVALLAAEKTRIEQTGEIGREFIDYVADFFRTYADKTHHGKEEDVLFKALAAKGLRSEHKKLVEELVQEHVLGRKLVTDLVTAKERWLTGDRSALQEIIVAADELVKLYPRHIEKEDKQFFIPCMEYFSAEEQDAMLLEFWELDRQMIHLKYAQGLEALPK